MAIDPNIALGVRPIELPNQLAQYGMVSQIQNAQQANQLHQMQMAEYERARREEEGTRNFLAKADLSDPNVQMQLLTQYGKSGREIATNLTATQKARSEEAARQSKLAQDTQALYQNMSGMISNKNDAISFLKEMVNNPAMKDSPITRIPLMAQVAKIPDDPQGLDDWKKQFALGATKYITENKPVTFAQDTGSGGRVMARPGLGGTATVVPGSEFTKTKTFADINAEKQTGIAGSRLALEREKFNFEQKNPGYELKEDADGNFFGVNKRTLQSFPVMIGGGAGPAAPVAAPMVQGAGGMPGPRMAQPGAVVPAIPGMTSVLDQNMPAAAPTAGGPRQLVGKGTAMTEAQSKSAMFGAAMNQANGIISKVEKDGTTTAPVAVSVLQGLAKLSPQFLGSGENAANAIESIFRQDPTSLLGPDVNQQKLGQAQIAFATAYLRATSGAAFGPSEVSNTIKEYFPLVGEDKTVVKQKALARQRAIEGMKISTSKQGQSYIDKSGANANDPLGVR
jgi:hypothetical protein